MTVQLHLHGARLELDDVALENLARQLAPHVAEVLGDDQGERDQGWIRGARAAAEYLGCPRSRVYELVSRPVEEGGLEHRKEGLQPQPGKQDRRPLSFRREWLDATLDHGSKV